MTMLAEGLRVVDVDSHMTERHDLFTERAPKGYEDKVPHVEVVDGREMWVIVGKTFGKAGSGGTIDHDGNKHPFRDSQGGWWGIDDVHPAAWDPKERLRLMDSLGIDAMSPICNRNLGRRVSSSNSTAAFSARGFESA